MLHSKYLKNKELYDEFLEHKNELISLITNFVYEKYEYTADELESNEELSEIKKALDIEISDEENYTFLITDEDEDMVPVYVNRIKESDSLLFDDNVELAEVKYFDLDTVTSLVSELITDKKLTDKILTVYRKFDDNAFDFKDKVEIVVIYIFSNDDTSELFISEPITFSEHDEMLNKTLQYIRNNID